MKKKSWLIAASILLILVGALRSMTGISLLIDGNQIESEAIITASPLQANITAMILLTISILFIWSGINLLRTYSKKSWAFCLIALGCFFIGGSLSGFLLFGQPISGQLANLIVVILIGTLLFLGKSTLKSEIT